MNFRQELFSNKSPEIEILEKQLANAESEVAPLRHFVFADSHPEDAKILAEKEKKIRNLKAQIRSAMPLTPELGPNSSPEERTIAIRAVTEYDELYAVLRKIGRIEIKDTERDMIFYYEADGADDSVDLISGIREVISGRRGINFVPDIYGLREKVLELKEKYLKKLT